jgi:hypothetical protein
MIPRVFAASNIYFSILRSGVMKLADEKGELEIVEPALYKIRVIMEMIPY